jgi:CBS domain containing-hemolysin-like protein
MTPVALELAAIAFCLAFLVFLSSIESAITQSSLLALRMMLEHEKPPALLPVVLDNKMHLLVPLHLGTQVSLITIAILTTHLSLQHWSEWGLGFAFLIIFVLSLLFRQLFPRLLTQNDPEEKLVWLLGVFYPIYRMLRSLALPLSSVLRVFKRLPKPATGPASEEKTEEEIQAYLDIGEDEGILEAEDTKLIQSVVEFGDTLVREVMTPRTEIIGCEEKATIAELKSIMVNHHHSRIPIYQDDLDHIIGIAHIRQLLAHFTQGRESDPIGTLVYPALFVPETKPVSTLLKELQARGDHTAIVIDEFGGVAGLVTMEDLLEEIVGEIRDEDQAHVSEVVEESPRSYVLRGSVELYRLEELSGKKFDDTDCSTVAGLIVAHLGRVPVPGEEFDLEDLHVQILDADRRRLHKMRIRLPEAIDDLRLTIDE